MLNSDIQEARAPIFGQAKVAEGGGRLHALVAQVVNREDAPRILSPDTYQSAMRREQLFQ